MSKTLTIGHDYGGVFGLDKDKGQHMIYRGGNTWTAKKPGAERTSESEKTTRNALEYINRPPVHIGA